MAYRKSFAALLLAGLLLLAQARGAQSASPCNRTVAEIYQAVSASVLEIVSVTIDSFSVTERIRIESGTGVVFDGDGNIVTNAHVVYGAKQLFVVIEGVGFLEARLVGADPVSDLAVIKLIGGIAAPPPKVNFDTSDQLLVGQGVVAVGFPLGIGKTASQGIVSGLGRLLPITTMSWLVPMIQTDAAINPGNSGGPLIDLCGNVIGINTRQNGQAENIAFAIPASVIRQVVPELISHGRVLRAWHGINGKIVPEVFSPILGVPPGLLVETVEPGSPAQQIGLKGGQLRVAIGIDEYLLGGEVILSVNGQPLSDMNMVAHLVRSFKVGDRVTLTYWQNGQELTTTVVLPERPTLAGDLIAIGRAGATPGQQ
jgi:S1-C subfamily serine protease